MSTPSERLRFEKVGGIARPGWGGIGPNYRATCGCATCFFTSESEFVARGDHIYIEGVLHGIPYQHHGIDVGDGTVIHLAPAEGARIAIHDASDRFSVRRDSVETFSGGKSLHVKRHLTPRSADDTVAAAESHLGRTGYCLLDGNCEHFATLCATGSSRSHQVEMAEATLSAVASMATKSVWAVSSRVGSRALLKGAARVHPAMLLADGAEVAALAVGCRQGFDVERSRRIARISGNVVAFGVGGLVGGPAGAAFCLATHSSSTAIADQLCKSIRNLISGAKRDAAPQLESSMPCS
ncbi:MAG: lecithin retinol acyltransferase family protein [Pirellulaceae bacterium]